MRDGAQSLPEAVDQKRVAQLPRRRPEEILFTHPLGLVESGEDLGHNGQSDAAARSGIK